jgi:hypothetical protein
MAAFAPVWAERKFAAVKGDGKSVVVEVPLLRYVTALELLIVIVSEYAAGTAMAVRMLKIRDFFIFPVLYSSGRYVPATCPNLGSRIRLFLLSNSLYLQPELFALWAAYD